MERHRPLTVTGSRSTLESIAACLGARSVNGWSRDERGEAEMSRHLGDDDRMWLFQCDGRGVRKPAVVCLTINSRGDLDVVNIVPLLERAMDMRECNVVIESFHDDLLSPCASEAGVHVDFGEAHVDVADFMTSECAKKLRSFSGTANKATGASHPLDQRRWLEFLISAHKENAELGSEELQGWLVSDGWSADMAEELASRYDQARHLLRAYDKK